MYNEYFGLKEAPFSIAPDPRYLFMSEQHREALAHLVYGFNSGGGFVLLTGEVGTGKTTVCRCLLEQIPDNTVIAFILNPKLTVQELLATVCDEFGIKYPPDNTSIKVFVDLINAYLLEAHAKDRKAVLLIDEAQNLSAEVLEQLRLLTNLETNQRKLLQIILIGQPELRDKLSEPGLRQLSQRIIARYHLGALLKKDISAYVSHRLSVAGLRDQLFPAEVINKLYHLTGGVPRLINVLCDRALLGTYAMNKNLVSTSTLTKAAHEVFGESRFLAQGLHRKAAMWIISSFIIAVGVVVASTYYKEKQPEIAVHKTIDKRLETAVLESINKKKETTVYERVKPDIIEAIQSSKLNRPADQPLDSPPPDFTSVIKPGMRGPAVQWLETQLSLFDGKPNTPRDNPEYDDELINRVKKFQSAKGLIPDGIVGSQTMIRLVSAGGEDRPTLDEKLKDNQ